jgi:hypothetical protein
LLSPLVSYAVSQHVTETRNPPNLGDKICTASILLRLTEKDAVAAIVDEAFARVAYRTRSKISDFPILLMKQRMNSKFRELLTMKGSRPDNEIQSS